MTRMSRIGRLVGSGTGARFESELTKYTRLGAAAARALFPTEPDQEELLELLEIVNGAENENVARARLVANIGKVAGAVMKIGKRFATGR